MSWSYNAEAYKEKHRMTNFERIKQMDRYELAKFLCDNSDCSMCPAAPHCHKGHNAMLEWLKGVSVNESR